MESVMACTGSRIQASVSTVATWPKQHSAATHKLPRDPRYFITMQHGILPRTATRSRSRTDIVMDPTQADSEYLPNYSSNTDISNVPCHLKRVQRRPTRGLYSSKYIPVAGIHRNVRQMAQPTATVATYGSPKVFSIPLPAASTTAFR